jgi:hypothetical protein
VGLIFFVGQEMRRIKPRTPGDLYLNISLLLIIIAVLRKTFKDGLSRVHGAPGVVQAGVDG